MVEYSEAQSDAREEDGALHIAGQWERLRATSGGRADTATINVEAERTQADSDPPAGDCKDERCWLDWRAARPSGVWRASRVGGEGLTGWRGARSGWSTAHGRIDSGALAPPNSTAIGSRRRRRWSVGRFGRCGATRPLTRQPLVISHAPPRCPLVPASPCARARREDAL